MSAIFHSIDSSTYSHQLLYFILQFLVLHTSNSSTSNSQLQYFTSYILVHHFPSSSTSIVTLLCLISFHFSFFSLCISVLSHSHMYTICTIKNRKSQIKPPVDLQQMSYRSFPDNLSIKTASISFANS